MSNKPRTSTYVTDVPCSFCGAQPGNWCKNLNGARRQIGPHRARVELHRLTKLVQTGEQTSTEGEDVMSNKFQEGHAFTISRQPVTVYEVTPNVVIGAVTGIDGDRFGATWDVNTGEFLSNDDGASLDYAAPALNLRPNVVLSSAEAREAAGASPNAFGGPLAMRIRTGWYRETPEPMGDDGCEGCAFLKTDSCHTATARAAEVFGGDCAERGVIYTRVEV